MNTPSSLQFFTILYNLLKILYNPTCQILNSGAYSIHRVLRICVTAGPILLVPFVHAYVQRGLYGIWAFAHTCNSGAYIMCIY